MTASTPVDRVAEILAAAGYKRIATPSKLPGLSLSCRQPSWAQVRRLISSLLQILLSTTNVVF
jgi:hypothetical protein